MYSIKRSLFLQCKSIHLIYLYVTAAFTISTTQCALEIIVVVREAAHTRTCTK